MRRRGIAAFAAAVATASFALPAAAGYTPSALLPRALPKALPQARCARDLMAESCDDGVCKRPSAAESAGMTLRLQGGGAGTVVFDVYSDPA